MEPAPNLIEDAAFAYTRLVRKVNEDAAAAIEKIHADFGSQAALRAALIITILKMEVQQNHWIPKIDLYDHLLEDYPDALVLTKYAMNCCLQSWAITEVETIDGPNWQVHEVNSDARPPRKLRQTPESGRSAQQTLGDDNLDTQRG